MQYVGGPDTKCGGVCATEVLQSEVARLRAARAARACGACGACGAQRSAQSAMCVRPSDRLKPTRQVSWSTCQTRVDPPHRSTASRLPLCVSPRRLSPCRRLSDSRRIHVERGSVRRRFAVRLNAAMSRRGASTNRRVLCSACWQACKGLFLWTVIVVALGLLIFPLIEVRCPRRCAERAP